MNRRFLWIALTAGLLADVGRAQAVVPFTGMQDLPFDGYAAVVNDRVITIGDVMGSIHELNERLRILHGGADLESRRLELFRSGLEKLIDQSLMLEEYKKMKGSLPERVVDDRVNEVIFQHFNNDRSKLLSTLAEDGTTFDEWRETIKERLIVSVMRANAIGSKIVISPKQIVDAYNAQKKRYVLPEKVRLRLIYVRMGADQVTSGERIQMVYDEIAAGKSFEDAAREYSNDASASAGGDWGWINPAELREELKSVVDHLPENKVSDILFTTEGYYLIQVQERQATTTRTFEEVRLEIEKELREKEGERLYNDWISRLRNKHSVLYYIQMPPRQS